jgi:hypothetical protein
LSRKHGVQTAGFDLPGADEAALAEIVAAVDAVLSRYPFLLLRRVSVAELPAEEWSRVSWARDGRGAPAAAEIVVTASAVLDPEGFGARVAEAVARGDVTPVSSRRPVYSTTLRALGEVADVTGGFTARTVAHRALVAAYLGAPRRPGASLATVVGGVREWRDQLSRNCFYEGRFHSGPALAEAFTAVEAAGRDADEPARVLHAVLMEAARRGSAPPVAVDS